MSACSACGCLGGPMNSLRHDDLLIPQGTDWAIDWPVNDADGIPIDLSTGWTAKAQARAQAGTAGAPRQEWTSADPTQISLEDGFLRLHTTPTMTNAWTWLKSAYDIELTGPSGIVRLTQGTITVSPSVTT